MKPITPQTKKRKKPVLTIQDRIQNLTEEIKFNLKELSISQRETDRQIEKTNRQMEETNKQMKETDKKLKAFIGESGNGWGKLGENLVKGSLARKLNERGIQVERVMTNVKNKFSEFDLIAINGKETLSYA